MTRRPFLIAAVAVGYLWAGQGDLEQARAKTYTPPPVVEQPPPPAPEQPVTPPAEPPPPVVEPPAQAVEPPVIAPVAPVTVAAPRVVLGGAVRVTTVRTRCRVYRVRPARAVGPRTTPRYGQVRVRRGVDGRLYGYADMFRITKTTLPSGSVRIRVTWTPGAYCGPLSVAVAG